MSVKQFFTNGATVDIDAATVKVESSSGTVVDTAVVEKPTEAGKILKSVAKGTTPETYGTEWATDDTVKLAGAQTILGVKTFSEDIVQSTGILNSTNTSITHIYGGSEKVLGGADLNLYGSANGGCFIMNACDGTNTKALKGNPNGELTWGNTSTPETVLVKNVTASDYNKYLHANETTGALEWSEVTGATYQTTAPTEAISDNGVHIVDVVEAPDNLYNGYLYLIGSYDEYARIVAPSGRTLFTVGTKPIPFYIEALTAGDLTFGATTLTNAYYKVDSGEWQSYTKGTTIATQAGKKYYFKAESCVTSSDYSDTHIVTANNMTYNIGGDTKSLINNSYDMTGNSFSGLFSSEFSRLKAINSDFKLSATILSESCYASMFSTCSAITSIPATLLPVATLADYCYQSMFDSCTGLTEIPAGFLPATTLANSCYSSMFKYCFALTSLPADLLPATTLKESCYQQMFYGCNKLATIPVNLLPATTLAKYCYCHMFDGCTSLATLPKICATTFPSACCQYTFYKCTSIKLSATQEGEYVNTYKVPFSEAPVSVETNALAYMFGDTGGTVTSAFTVDTTYYTSNTVV